MSSNTIKHMGAWLPVPVIAVVNGALRDLVYGKLMSETVAHSVSVLPLTAAIVAWAWLLAGWAPLRDRRAGVWVGLTWLVLTLLFELGLGALRGVELRVMLMQYDITRGHLWPLVPLTMAVAPELARQLARHRRRRPAGARGPLREPS